MRFSIKQGDAMSLLSGIEPGSIDAVIMDPPYFKVLKDSWDRQWANKEEYLEWLEKIFVLLQQKVAPCGCLYCFAWPSLASRVELALEQHFTVLNHIVWDKGSSTTIARANKGALTRFFNNSERIIFCEKKNRAKDEIKTARGDFLYEPIRAYLSDGWARAGLEPEEADRTLGTKIAARSHYFGSGVFWRMISKRNYERLQARAGKDFLPKSYADLSCEYAALREQHEQAKRPFFVSKSAQHSDVWNFAPNASGTTQHPAQKPLPLMEHIVSTSTRADGIILDPFMGSGTTGVAALRMGRRFIGFERDPEYFAIAEKRLVSARQGEQHKLLWGNC